MDLPRYDVLELCRNRAGFEAAPEVKLSLDLEDVQATLEGAGWTTLANAGIILVARIGTVEASVFESGKLLFKTREAEKAAAAMTLFFQAMGWGAAEVRVRE